MHTQTDTAIEQYLQALFFDPGLEADTNDQIQQHKNVAVDTQSQTPQINELQPDSETNARSRAFVRHLELAQRGSIKNAIQGGIQSAAQPVRAKVGSTHPAWEIGRAHV